MQNHSSLRTRIVSTPSTVTGPSRSFYQAIVRATIDWKFYEVSYIQNHFQSSRDSLGLGTAMSSFAIIRDQSMRQKIFVWNIHHSIYDAWLLPRILSDLDNAYYGKPLNPTHDFNTFVKHVVEDSDRNAAEDFWLPNLQDASTNPWPKLPSSAYRPRASSSVRRSLKLSPSRPASITVPTLIRAAWAMLLGHYSDSADVVYIVTIHGRSAPLPSIVDVNGPTIATIHLRVQFDRSKSIRELLDNIQDTSGKIIPFEHFGLQNIFSASVLSSQK